MIASKTRTDLKHPQLRFYLNSLTLFANLPANDAVLFRNAAQIMQYKKGEILYIEDDKAAFVLGNAR
jgi:hypothetical protein